MPPMLAKHVTTVVRLAVELLLLVQAAHQENSTSLVHVPSVPRTASNALMLVPVSLAVRDSW